MQKIENKINLKHLFFLFISIILLISNTSLIFAEKELSKFLTTTNLGQIETTGQKPTKDEIIVKIKELNNDLKESKSLKIDNDPTETEAIVKSNEHTGEVKVYFTVKKTQTPLSKFLTTTNLGKIETTGQKPTKDEVITKIKTLNKDLTESHSLKIDNDPTQTEAIIKSNNNTGEIKVSFTVEKKENTNHNTTNNSETVTESNPENTSFFKNKWLWTIIILMIITSVGFFVWRKQKISK
ncbi:hypothetical protein CWO85_01775 [Candidatus Phytoplasma ziziphi]|uniref:Uncharacterized protein n=1 Tax=Ziziphus jujuba witches'-broom phytoplasma TaxID=135727 RepID=A0A660HMN9_ZIZJU|nr:hypothetical protein [Candidatus Phytoplasma ziziphi]AYJ01252.1 hypothetical protein CWO85_01775 [Candidatus Phytoplasma ziziphi]